MLDRKGRERSILYADQQKIRILSRGDQRIQAAGLLKDRGRDRIRKRKGPGGVAPGSFDLCRYHFVRVRLCDKILDLMVFPPAIHKAADKALHRLERP